MMIGLLLMTSAIGFVQTGDITSNDCLAWLNDNFRQGGTVRIEAYCKCGQDGNISYSITTSASGKSGNSQAVQRGKKLVHAGNTELLAQVNLGGDPRKYSIQLDIYRDGVIVAKSSSIIGEN